MNKKVFRKDSVRKVIDMSGSSIDSDDFTPEKFAKLPLKDKTATISEAMFYLSKHEDGKAHSVSIWVVADPESERGREMMLEAVRFAKASPNSRVGFLFNPENEPSAESAPAPLTGAIQIALETQSMTKAKLFVIKLLKEENAKDVLFFGKNARELSVDGMDMGKFDESMAQAGAGFVAIYRDYASSVGIAPGERALIVNGIVYDGLGHDEIFYQSDLETIEKLVLNEGASKLRDQVVEGGEFAHANEASDFVAKAYGILSNSERLKKQKRRINFNRKQLKTEHSAILLEPEDPSQPAFQIEAVLDPLSRDAQKLSQLLVHLHKMSNSRVTVYLNCRAKLSELPLSSFYRYVIDSKLSFDAKGALSEKAMRAQFDHLPQNALLTMNILAPGAWMPDSALAVHDLDNIRLESTSAGVYAEFSLDHILLEGSARDISGSSSARGIQLDIGTCNEQHVYDTLVMANLGYFQLKAAPGVWQMSLRPGRTASIYRIQSHESADSEPFRNDTALRVVISSFTGKIIKLNVQKRAGMESMDILGSEDTAAAGGGGLFDSISASLFKNNEAEAEEAGKALETTTTPDADDALQSGDILNIFSVASGHLYERLLRVMMVSVLRKTTGPVKFWFLKNYLSPDFKAFLPVMAEQYNFHYELVQYKWPRWLNAQTEKQRIIWGYKILFLDVLFPLNVKKIIFVDADQTVRVDMRDLRDLDLEGAPYGYTPFCDSRKEMEGYRFWNQGYWRNHLGHRKYHISALYVVDLFKFRKIAAGDRLRSQYQALSQDKSSLSNLDQE